MSGSYFTPLQQTGTTARYRAEAATIGPWAEHLQHGGPPNALAVTVAEQLLSQQTGRSDLRALRLAADFVGPVPVAELDVTGRVLRTARSAALVEVTLAAAGRDCLHARVWFVRDADTSAVAAPLPAAAPVPQDLPGLDAAFPYGDSLEWRFVRGAMRAPGPGAAWVRPHIPVLVGHEMSGLARAALIADSASGLSAELDWSDWSFLNIDLDVHLARPPVGEWILMEAATQLGGNGSALARSTLSDPHGPFGAGLQTLVVAPMRR
ncbi:MAG TPA: thioesterase family protein [Jatrophihabitans sp.]|nr:thioesterase family protein [Jatrophihabitans sp.]